MKAGPTIGFDKIDQVALGLRFHTGQNIRLRPSFLAR